MEGSGDVACTLVINVLSDIDARSLQRFWTAAAIRPAIVCSLPLDLIKASCACSCMASSRVRWPALSSVSASCWRRGRPSLIDGREWADGAREKTESSDTDEPSDIDDEGLRTNTASQK
eukprot:scaffold10410_cov31-Tisochrysis_lutea.AAC.2